MFIRRRYNPTDVNSNGSINRNKHKMIEVIKLVGQEHDELTNLMDIINSCYSSQVSLNCR